MPVLLLLGAGIGFVMLFDRSSRPARRVGARTTPITLTTTSAHPTDTQRVPFPTKNLRPLFTRVPSDGIVIVARAGLVSTAEANGCPVVPVASDSGSSQCKNTTASGVQFDFSAPGQPWYRLTVLASDVLNSPRLEPLALGSLVRLVHADGSTTDVAGTSGLHIAVLHGFGLANVRVHLSDRGQDTMTPVAGWVAFAADSHVAFGASVEGLNESGRVVETAFPLRCC